MDLYQEQILALMGIQVWRPRDSDAFDILPISEQSRIVPSDPKGLDWEGLARTVASCTACGLHTMRSQTVFGSGDQQARLLLIGEAPGAEEDRQGLPFVGRAGQLLTEMLFAIGLRRDQVYIANTLKCRPPNNRDPQPVEVAHCAVFLSRQIQLIQPKIILTLGLIAAHNVLKTDESLARLRGKPHRLVGENIPVYASYHPAYLLRSPGDKQKAWEDLQVVARILGDDKI